MIDGLAAVVVSQRVGVIKPRAAIFQGGSAGTGRGVRAANPARALGWRAALVRIKPDDSSLPVAPPVDVVADLEIDTVLDLEAAIGLHPGLPLRDSCVGFRPGPGSSPAWLALGGPAVCGA